MFEINSEQGSPSPLNGSVGNRTRFHGRMLTPRLRTRYALISFLLGAIYLKIIISPSQEFSTLSLISLLIGGMCFTVCIFNLVSLWRERRQLP